MAEKTAKSTIDCACVIHGDAYPWEYVDRLYNSLKKNIGHDIRMHVYTEAQRQIPIHYIKHPLQEWSNVHGPKRAWWYKMQLFRSDLHAGPMFYLDLDTVITGNLDWIFQQDLKYFWCIKDFKSLWKRNYDVLNSSILWFDTTQWDWVWRRFLQEDINMVMRTHHGDQNYINQQIPLEKKRYLDAQRIVSYRWQVREGGWDFRRHCARMPGQPTQLSDDVNVLIFHGSPKPHEANDPVVAKYWG